MPRKEHWSIYLLNWIDLAPIKQADSRLATHNLQFQVQIAHECDLDIWVHEIGAKCSHSAEATERKLTCHSCFFASPLWVGILRFQSALSYETSDRLKFLFKRRASSSLAILGATNSFFMLFVAQFLVPNSYWLISCDNLRRWDQYRDWVRKERKGERGRERRLR